MKRIDCLTTYSLSGIVVFVVVSVCFAISAVSAQAPTATSTPINGSFEKITVHGRSLEGNLEGDSPDRDVFVYLPPSYARDTTRRYPVTRLGVAHRFETYEGNHTNRVRERFETKVLPFFSEQLRAEKSR
jgi:hypothetical protein